MANLFGKMTSALEAMDASMGAQQGVVDTNRHHHHDDDSHDDGHPHDVSRSSIPRADDRRQTPSSVQRRSASNSDVDAILRSSEQYQETERKQRERDATFLALQRNYDDSIAKIKSLDAQLVQSNEDLRELSRIRAELREETNSKSLRVASLEKELADEQERFSRVDAQLNDAQQSLESQRQESTTQAAQIRNLEQALRRSQADFADHKSKTRMLLQEKDAEIERVRAASDGASASDQGGEHSDGSAAKALESLRQRLTLAEQQRDTAEAAAAESKAALQKALKDAATASNQLESGAMQLQEAKHATLVAQSMYEGEVSSHQSTRHRFEALLKEKDEEIRSLEKRQHHRGGSGGGEEGASGSGGHSGSSAATSTAEWERRAKDLADLVMEKQAALEAKRGECDQWRTRYEIAQQKVREMELMSASVQRNSGGSTAVAIPSSPQNEEYEVMAGDFSRSQFFGNLSRKGVWGKRITGAASRLDYIAIIGGNMLRRNSVMRVAAILYILTLHIWVFFIVSVSFSVPMNARIAEPKL